MPRKLRIMTYNVRYFGHRTRGLITTEKALRQIADALAELDPLPDVVCLQEVETYSVRADIGRSSRGRKPQLERLTDALNARLEDSPTEYESVYFASHRYGLTKNASLYTTGLGILVANTCDIVSGECSPPVDITHRRIKATARWKQTRICAHLHVKHRDSKTPLDIYNTHLSLPQFLSLKAMTFTRQMGYGPNQLAELDNVLEFIADSRSSDHLVLMGDFNSLPGSPVYKGVLDSGVCIDPLFQARDFDLDGYRNFPSAGFMNFRMHLDYLFSSPSLEWVDFEDTHPYGSTKSQFNGLSDHAPIIGRARPG